jgi:hypothetical protein
VPLRKALIQRGDGGARETLARVRRNLARELRDFVGEGELVSRTVDGFGVRHAASDDRMCTRLGKPAPEPTAHISRVRPRRLQAADAGRRFAKNA